MVDQHNGSRGCKSKCDAWCSGSQTTTAHPASSPLPLDWITGSSKVFDLSIFLRSCLQFFFLSFLFQSLDPSMISSFPCQILSSAFVRGCTLSFALRLALGLPLPFPWAPPGDVTFFWISFLEILAIILGGRFRELKPHLLLSPLHPLLISLSRSFSHKMRHIIQVTVQAGVSRAPLLFLLRLSDVLQFFRVCP